MRLKQTPSILLSKYARSGQPVCFRSEPLFENGLWWRFSYRIWQGMAVDGWRVKLETNQPGLARGFGCGKNSFSPTTTSLPAAKNSGTME